MFSFHIHSKALYTLNFNFLQLLFPSRSLHFLQRPDVCCCGSITLAEIKKRILRRLVRSLVVLAVVADAAKKKGSIHTDEESKTEKRRSTNRDKMT